MRQDLTGRILLKQAFQNRNSHKAKRLQKNFSCGCLSKRITDTLFYFQQKKALQAILYDKMSKLFENEKSMALGEEMYDEIFTVISD